MGCFDPTYGLKKNMNELLEKSHSRCFTIVWGKKKNSSSIYTEEHHESDSKATIFYTLFVFHL